MNTTTDKPKRIQRKRTKGYKMPPAIYVGRPTKWGNPHRVEGNQKRDAVAVRNAVLAYERTLDPATIAAAKRELRGKDLACWCAPGQPCHADVLLRIANEQ
jgi:hypothetical protein